MVAFFLKFILWVPPTNPLNTYRLIIWFRASLPPSIKSATRHSHIHACGNSPIAMAMGFSSSQVQALTWSSPIIWCYRLSAAVMGLPATLEYYEYINSPSSTVMKIGFFAWLTLAVTVVEILICIKFGRRVFTAPWPQHVVWFWAITGALSCTFIGLWYLRVALSRGRRQKTE